jgi:hypothetical protein
MGKKTIRRVISHKKNAELTAKVASNTNYLHESMLRTHDVIVGLCEYLEQPWWRRLTRKSLPRFFDAREQKLIDEEKAKSDSQNFTHGSPAVIPEPQEPSEG